jgi:ankyrin repeat protein
MYNYNHKKQPISSIPQQDCLNETTITLDHEENGPCRLLKLPVELLIDIFVYAQNPALAITCSNFWHLGYSSTLRAQYLMHRYGPTAVLGETSMKRKIVSLQVVEQLLRLNCCDPKADGDYWLFARACELNQVSLARWVIQAALRFPGNDALNRLCNIAAIKGSIPVTDLLIHEFHVDIHQPNGQENALMLACRGNHVSLVKHLALVYNCNLHSSNELCLRNACLQGFETLVHFLLQSGANVHAYNDAALQSAAYKGFSSIIKLLIDAGAHADTNQNACIQHAITNGDLATVRHLIEDGGVNPQCAHDWPMRHACRLGLDDIVDYLLQVIPSEDAVNMRNGMPLREAIAHGRVSTMILLLNKKANPNSVGVIRGLQIAVNPKTRVRNKDAMFEMLLEAGLDVSQQPNDIYQYLIPAFASFNKNDNKNVISWV